MGASSRHWGDAGRRGSCSGYLTAANHARGKTGAFLQVQGGSSTLTADGVRFPVPLEAWELASVHQATTDVRNAAIFGEFYVAGQASFTVTDSQHHDVFFEVCPGDDYELVDLPELCDLGVRSPAASPPGTSRPTSPSGRRRRRSA